MSRYANFGSIRTKQLAFYRKIYTRFCAILDPKSLNNMHQNNKRLGDIRFRKLYTFDIVRSVYHFVIYMQANKIHNVVSMKKF